MKDTKFYVCVCIDVCDCVTNAQKSAAKGTFDL